MALSETNTWVEWGQIVAIPAFVLSVIPYFAKWLRKPKPGFQLERQIQLTTGFENLRPSLHFNVLSIIYCDGPDTKWATLKFDSAEMTLPDGRGVAFRCEAYLSEREGGQVNESRNIPVALRGGDSRTVTAAYSVFHDGGWQVGTHRFSIRASDSRGASLASYSFAFSLTESDLVILRSTANTLKRKWRGLAEPLISAGRPVRNSSGVD